jgi:hypothetical protein
MQASAVVALLAIAGSSTSLATPPFTVREAVHHSVQGYSWLLELCLDLAIKHDYEEQHRSQFVHGPTLRNITEIFQEYTHLKSSTLRNVSIVSDDISIEMTDVPVFHSTETATELFSTFVEPDNAKYLADFSQTVGRSFYGNPSRGQAASSVWTYYSTLTLLLTDPLQHSEDRNQDGNALVGKYRALAASLAKEGSALFAGLGKPFMGHNPMRIIIRRYPAQIEAYVAAFARTGSVSGLQPEYVGADAGYLLSAKRGSVAAMKAVAALYYTGDGVVVNHTAAVEWYRVAAGSEDNDAQLALALLLCERHPADCHSDEVMNNLQASADGGNLEANYELAGALLPELDEALPYYERAAERGHTFANLDLGRLYMEGQHGMRVNHTLGVQHVLRAAEDGLADAQTYSGEYQGSCSLPHWIKATE